MSGPLLWGVQQEKQGSCSSCFAELKSIDAVIKEIKYLQHLMKQLGIEQ